MKVLITGGAGFVGSHVVKYLLNHTDWDIISLDRLDTSGNLNRLAEVLIEWVAQEGVDERKTNRLKVLYHDLKSPIGEQIERQIIDCDYVLHLAAGSHVDRSIQFPMEFAMDNVIGTTNILDFARKMPKLKKFINFSTDEVFGPAYGEYRHKEEDPFKPSNPYAASKAGAVCMGFAFHVTYNLPVITTFTMNIFGERQHPEKLITKTIRSVVEGTPMPIHCKKDDAGNVVDVGSRFWLHAENVGSALHHILQYGVVGESYNVVSDDELKNDVIAQKIADIVGKPLDIQWEDFHKSRPGHDRRYALDSSKLKDLGWTLVKPFDESLEETVKFALEHPQWI